MSEMPTHSGSFRLRRFVNWFPLGLTYAFLYMGRYNLTVAKTSLGDLMTKEDFGIIFATGTLTYAFSFLINGPLTDRIGGKKAILIGAFGSGTVNLIMGLYISAMTGGAVCETAPHLRLVFSILYAVNMYFQSYGAVAIVKVNAHWFHVRERGGFSGIFGTMISSGIFFAFTVNFWILDMVSQGTGDVSATRWVFFAPSALLFSLFVVELFLLKDRPGLAGHQDFDTGDASSGEEGLEIPVLQIIKRIFTNPIIITVALIEFCTGVLRNGVMHWYPIYAKEVLSLPGDHPMLAHKPDWLVVLGLLVVAVLFAVLGYFARGKRRAGLIICGALIGLAPFMNAGWGGILMVAGVIGGNVAGWVSDLFFQSRRAPTAGLLYLTLSACAIFMYFTLGTTTNEVQWSRIEATEQHDALLPKDRIIEVEGIRDIDNWEKIGKAVACIPSTCLCDTQWDSKNCTCASEPEETDPRLRPGDGQIHLTVQRGVDEVPLSLADSKRQMYAGDKRTLKAGPVLPMSPYWLGLIVFMISLCVIGTHGLLSGTATMDFGGRKGAATAVGMIDGFVYLGTGVQSLSLGYLTTYVGWWSWPIFLFPFGIIGLLLLLKIWKAVPTGKKGGL